MILPFFKNINIFLGSKQELEKFVREFDSNVQEKETQLVQVAVK